MVSTSSPPTPEIRVPQDAGSRRDAALRIDRAPPPESLDSEWPLGPAPATPNNIKWPELDGFGCPPITWPRLPVDSEYQTNEDKGPECRKASLLDLDPPIPNRLVRRPKHNLSSGSISSLIDASDTPTSATSSVADDTDFRTDPKDVFPGNPKHRILASRYGQPCNLLPASFSFTRRRRPKSIASINTDEALSSGDDDSDPEDLGSREDAIGKFRPLSIIIYFLLLREHVSNLESSSAASLTGSSVSGGQDHESGDNGDGDDGPNGTEKPANKGENAQGQPSSSSGHRGHRKVSRKRKVDQTEDDEDDGDGPKNNKHAKSSKKGPLKDRLACPYAKAYPESFGSCVLINRQNLPGIKEHLKRNHFKPKGEPLPQEILKAKTWEQVFRICNPSWDPNTPLPDPYFSYGNTISRISKEDEIVIAERQIVTRPQQATGSGVNGPQQVDTPLTEHPTQRDVALETTENSRAGTLGSPLISLGAGSYMAATFPTGQVNLSPHATTILSNLAEPQISLQHDLALQPSREIDDAAAQEAYRRLAQDLGIPSDFPEVLLWDEELFGSSSTQDVAPPSTYSFENESLIPPRFSFTNLPAGSATASTSAQSGPADEMLYLTETPDTATSISEPINFIRPLSEKTKEKSDGLRFSLAVARHPRVLESEEDQNPKEFEYDDRDDFEYRFDGWMSETFYDPKFSWETMEFTWETMEPQRTSSQADPEPPFRLSSLKGLALQVDMYYMRTGKRRSGVHLVARSRRDKGKQKAH
ncbi:hypothetical protein TWF481_006160 [Arthrobotrys musiformis]|uniref:Uncharacterized protein n=1 Tax=Arthrobotrys musiformis TaxID=47236 RepID=A0AAV9WFX6_9PEZI